MRHWMIRSGIGCAVSAVVLLSIICVIVPLSPGMPDAGIDPSWRYAMNQAVAQGLIFGKDVVFTFGPYASIYTAIYHPATDGLMMGASLYFALSLAGLLIFLGNRQRRWMPVLVTIALIVVAIYSRDILFFLYALLVALAVVELDVGRPGVAVTARPLWKIFFFFLPLGLLPLIKGSFFILASATVILTVVLWCYQKHYKYAISAIVTPAAGLAFFWIVAGQPFGALFAYLGTMFTSISGYTEAMSVQGQSLEIWLYLGAATILLISAITVRVRHPVSRAYLFVMLGLSLFLTFKAGFVRHDGHALAATFFLFVCSLVFAPILRLPQRAVSIVAGLTLAVISSSYYVKLDLPAIARIFSTTYTRAFVGLDIRMFHRDVLSGRFNIAVKALADKSGIPKLSGTTDIYSYDQSSLIASGNAWNPRPVLQSYAAYTPTMLQLNARHLQGTNAPDNIIFKVEPIDGRLPTMEDGASWPAMFTNYHPVEMDDNRLYLSKNGGQQDVQEKVISTGVYSLGESVDVPDTTDVVFAEIHVSQSVLGKAANILFKPSVLRVEFTLANGEIRTYRFVSSMAETGILVSPLIENTVEFTLAYDDRDYLAQKEVRSFRILALSQPYEWKENYQVTFKALRFSRYDGAKKLIKYDPLFPVPANVAINLGGQCEGSIDALNGTMPAPPRFTSSGWLDVSGWLASSIARGAVPEKTFVVLSDGAGNRTFYQTRLSPRPDVGAYFGKPQLGAAGYAAMIETSALQGGYTLGLAYLDKNKIVICSQFGIPGAIDARRNAEASNGIN